MESYLHIFITDLSFTDKNAAKGDINLGGKSDYYFRINYNGYIQDTKILKDESGSVAFNEPLILEDASPATDEKQSELTMTLMDWDGTMTSDDFICEGKLKVPMAYEADVAQKVSLIKNGKEIGSVSVAQVHFIKQKVRRYTGACKVCCCCLNTGR